jgi:hypothetical protein
MVIHSAFEMISYLLTTPFKALRLVQAVRESDAVIVFHGTPFATETAILEALAAPVEGEQFVVPARVVAHFASHFITQKSLFTPRAVFFETGT